MIPEAAAIGLPLIAFAEYLRTRRGPLVLLALAITHARAALVTGRWVAGQVPGMWRMVYPEAVKYVKEQG